MWGGRKWDNNREAYNVICFFFLNVYVSDKTSDFHCPLVGIEHCSQLFFAAADTCW